MEHTTSNAAELPSERPKKGLVERIKKANRLFILTVAVPTIVAIVYFGLIATDVYVSESRFVVRSASRQAQTSMVSALLQGTSFGRAQDETYPVIDYIQSRDALRELNRHNFIVDAYSQHGDFISRYSRWPDDSFEGLWRYYGRHIVSVDLDATSGITTLQARAYEAADAERINAALLDMGEHLINRMNERAAADTVQFAQAQYDAAAAKARDAAAAMASYRNAFMVFDPDKQSALQLQQVTALQNQLFDARTQLLQLLTISPANPQVPVLKTSIASLEKQIKDATGHVTGGKDSLSDKAAGYARLQVDSQFADKQLASAMSALDNARAEAHRKQLYLERLVQPNTPDVATEPKRIKHILEVFALGMIVWGVLSLMLAGLREHHD